MLEAERTLRTSLLIVLRATLEEEGIRAAMVARH
jgi:hypothetical protein